MKDLKTIEEEFVILNRQKDELLSRKQQLKNQENSTEELNKINQELKGIEELMKELQIEANTWASKYNEEPTKETIKMNSEDTKTVDEEIAAINKQIDYILNEARGKKMFQKYKNEQYYIPKAKRGEFLTLMHELDYLKKINNKNNFDTNNTYETIENPKIITEVESYEPFEETEEEKQKRQQELFEEIERKLNKNKNNINTEITPYDPVEEMEFIEGTTIVKPRIRKPYETDEEYEKYLEAHYNKYKNQFQIKKVRKPKSKIKIKRYLKKYLAIALTTVTLISGSIFIKNDFNKSSQSPITQTEFSVDNDVDENNNLINDEENEITINEDDSTSLNNDELNEQEESNLNIGSTITLNENPKIYKTAKDSLLEENQYRPYYDDNTEERVVLGVSILHENEIINIFACMDDANAKINELLNNGGTIESVLTGNIKHESSLKNFEGNHKLTKDEINEKAEGWYNINSVLTKNERGYSK